MFYSLLCFHPAYLCARAEHLTFILYHHPVRNVNRKIQKSGKNLFPLPREKTGRIPKDAPQNQRGLFVGIVQQLVSLALEVAVVEDVHQGVLVGLLDSHIAVRRVQAPGAGFRPGGLGAVDGLAAAHDAAAGAGHDLDEMVLLFDFTD